MTDNRRDFLKRFAAAAVAAAGAGCETPATGPILPEHYVVYGAPPRRDPQTSGVVYFDTDQSILRPDAKTTLDALAVALRSPATLQITVEGHCDERGTRDYNLALGERRANAIKKHLVAAGIDHRRIWTVSYGKERPAALGSTAEAWALNRRGIIFPGQ